jgi:N-formylglutamate amidohydrolase
MILHIPHSSQDTKDFHLYNRERELLRMTDHFTDELYSNSSATKVLFGVSRLICDVERFADDKEESMSKFGMGVCYTKDTEGKTLREFSQDDRETILKNFYYPHHQALELAVDLELEKKGSALIVDCHSFPDEAYHFNSDFGKKRPDICIGTDSFHTPKELIQKVSNYFQAKGYNTTIDKPYSGTMVPLKHYKKDKNIHSIMIEINRKLYIDESATKNEHFSILQEEIKELLNSLL